MSRVLSPTPCLLLSAALLVIAVWPACFVLCIGADGHLEFEPPHGMGRHCTEGEGHGTESEEIGGRHDDGDCFDSSIAIVGVRPSSFLAAPVCRTDGTVTCRLSAEGWTPLDRNLIAAALHPDTDILLI